MKKGNLILVGAMALVATQATAQTSTATTPAPVASPTLAERTNIRYTAYYFGASVGAPFDGVKTYTASAENGSSIAGYRNPSDQVSLRNRFDLRFKPTDSVKFGPTIMFDYKGRSNAGLTLLDPFLSASVSSLGAIGDVKFSGELRMGLPLSEASQKNTLVTTLNPRLAAGYAIPDTVLSLNSLTYPTFRIYRKTGTNQTFVFNQWFDATYQFNDAVNAYVAYNIGFNVAANKTSATDTFVELGANWNILPNLTFTPYVDLETDYRIALDTTLWGANLSWGIL